MINRRTTSAQVHDDGPMTLGHAFGEAGNLARHRSFLGEQFVAARKKLDLGSLPFPTRKNSTSGGDQNDALSRPERVMERFRDRFERVLRRNILQWSPGLNVVPKRVRIKLLVLPRVLIEDQQRLMRAFDGAFPE